MRKARPARCERWTGREGRILGVSWAYRPTPVLFRIANGEASSVDIDGEHFDNVLRHP